MSKIIAVKGFDKNLQCRGFQFEVGKTYKHDGEVRACGSGFHACENPLDVLSYYGVADSRFAEVEMSGELSRHAGDSKIASAEIHIRAELKLPDFIKRAVDYMMGLAKVDPNDYSKLAASGDYSNLAASGNASKLAASGDYSKLAASGYASKLAASGYAIKLAASGDYSNLAASGDYSIVAAAAYGCTGMIGPNGVLALAWHDGKRPRIAVAYVGEDGIKADTVYRLNDGGKFEEVL